MSVALATDPGREPASELTDAQYVKMWRNGDPAGWAGLFERHDGRLGGYLRRIDGKSSDVYDLKMDVWLQARVALPNYDPAQPFIGWLCGVAWNVVRRRWSARAKQASPEPLDDDNPRQAMELAQSGPDTPLLAGISQTDVRLALCRLSPVRQCVSYWHDGWGLSFREIGELLGRDPHTVASDDFRARQQLRALLDPTALERRASAN